MNNDTNRTVTRSIAKSLQNKILSANRELASTPNPENNKRTKSTSADRQKQVTFDKTLVTPRSKSTSTDQNDIKLLWRIPEEKGKHIVQVEQTKIFTQKLSKEQETGNNLKVTRRRRVSSDSDISGVQPNQVLGLRTSRNQSQERVNLVYQSSYDLTENLTEENRRERKIITEKKRTEQLYEKLIAPESAEEDRKTRIGEKKLSQTATSQSLTTNRESDNTEKFTEQSKVKEEVTIPEIETENTQRHTHSNKEKEDHTEDIFEELDEIFEAFDQSIVDQINEGPLIQVDLTTNNPGFENLPIEIQQNIVDPENIQEGEQINDISDEEEGANQPDNLQEEISDTEEEDDMATTQPLFYKRYLEDSRQHIQNMRLWLSIRKLPNPAPPLAVDAEGPAQHEIDDRNMAQIAYFAGSLKDDALTWFNSLIIEPGEGNITTYEELIESFEERFQFDQANQWREIGRLSRMQQKFDQSTEEFIREVQNTGRTIRATSRK